VDLGGWIFGASVWTAKVMTMRSDPKLFWAVQRYWPLSWSWMFLMTKVPFWKTSKRGPCLVLAGMVAPEREGRKDKEVIMNERL